MPDESQELSDLKTVLRHTIAELAAKHPDRIILHVPLSKLKGIVANENELMALLVRLDGHVGTPMPHSTPPLPFAYELHPLLATRRIEVLLLRDRLRKLPLRQLAHETALFAAQVAAKQDTEAVFSFTVPFSVLEHYIKLSNSRQNEFRARLTEEFEQVGLSKQGGNIPAGLVIRKDR